MTVINVSDVVSTSDLSFVLKAGDYPNLQGGATLTFDTSLPPLNGMSYNNALKKVIYSNSTQNIRILRFTGAVVATAATTELQTGFVMLSPPYVVPVDENGNRPSKIGFFVNGEDRYTECDSLADMYADERGLHFVYDNVTGVITTGDGVNGKAPVGEIGISSFYVEMNGNNFVVNNLSRIAGAGACVLINPNFYSGHHIDLDPDAHFCIVNNKSTFNSSNVVRHSYANFYLVGTGENNAAMLIGEGSDTDRIIYAIEGVSGSEKFQNYSRPLRGFIECRCLTEGSASQYAVARLYINVGGSAVVRILSGAQSVLEYRGSGGEVDVFYSTGYKRNGSTFSRGLYGRSEGVPKIKSFTRIGSESWPGRSHAFIEASSGAAVIGSDVSDIEFPADADFEYFFKGSGDSHCQVNRVINNGVVAQDNAYDISSDLGWVFSNVRINDSEHGCRASKASEYHHATMIGRKPVFSRGMNNSEIITSIDGLSGSVWFQPHHDGEGAEMLAGGMAFTDSRSYYESIGSKSRTRSDRISGVGIVSLIVVHGWLKDNFDIEFKLWSVDSPEPEHYAELSLEGVQAAQIGFTVDTDWYFDYTVEKVAGEKDEGYIEGIEFQCAFDPHFIWRPPGKSIYLFAPRLSVPVAALAGLLLFNLTQNKFIEFSQLHASEVYRSSALVEGVNVDRGDVIEVRACWQLGNRSSQKYVSRFLVDGSDVSLADGFVEHPNYGDLQIDGASMSAYLSVTSGSVKINIDDVDGDGFFDPRGVPSWYYYLLTTREGLLNYFYVADLVSETEFVLNANVPLDNTGERQIKLKNPERDQVQPFWIRSADPYFDFIGHDHSGGRGISYNVGRVYSAPPIAPSAEELYAAIINTSIPESL